MFFTTTLQILSRLDVLECVSSENRFVTVLTIQHLVIVCVFCVALFGFTYVYISLVTGPHRTILESLQTNAAVQFVSLRQLIADTAGEAKTNTDTLLGR